MDPTPTDEVPEIACPDCGQQMRLVGVERDTEKPDVNVLTFECPNGHFATNTFQN